MTAAEVQGGGGEGATGGGAVGVGKRATALHLASQPIK
jgi:hypothetical protein